MMHTLTLHLYLPEEGSLFPSLSFPYKLYPTESSGQSSLHLLQASYVNKSTSCLSL